MTTNNTRTAKERAEELLPTAEDIQEQFISGAMLTGFAYSRAEALRDWEAWREREQPARDAEPATVSAEQITAEIHKVTSTWDEPLDEVHDIPQITNALLARFCIEGDEA